MEFCSEAYNYNTTSDEDPRNLILLCTTQGLAVQQDGSGAQRLFHHAVDGAGTIHRYWLEAEKSRHKVGGPQVETEEERADAAARGKATSSVIGVRAMGTRFNVLMNIQVPLEQAPRPMRACYGSLASGKKTKKKKSGGLFSGFFGGAKNDCSAEVEGCAPPGFESDDGFDFEEDMMMCESASLASCASFGGGARRRCSSRSLSKPKVGSACAARVSRGSEFDTWKGLTAKTPKRNPAEHITCTVVIYNAVSGGVPSEADVLAAIDDLEQLYAACSTKGHLADQQFDFMKKELTVNDANDIVDKISTQPYKPPVQSVAGFNAFPL